SHIIIVSLLLLSCCFLTSSFINTSCHCLDLHSFPTRRSSDLKTLILPTMVLLPTAAFSLESLDDNELAEITGQDGVTINLTQSQDRKSTRLNSSHVSISYAVFCLKKKTEKLEICDLYATVG